MLVFMWLVSPTQEFAAWEVSFRHFSCIMADHLARVC